MTHGDGCNGDGRTAAAADRDDLEHAPASRPRAVTLSLRAPLLTLPGEDGCTDTVPPAAVPDPDGKGGPLDAWTLDKLKRSSLPPAMAQRAASAFPPPPRTPLPEPGEGADDGGVLSLVGRAGLKAPSAVDLVGEMADRFAVGDFTGALRVAELLLGQDASHDLAQHYARSSRDKLEAIYTSRLFAGGTVPELAVPESELRWLGLDPQIALVLARIDGCLDLEAVIAGSGLPRLDALRALAELLAGRIIRLV